MIEALLIGDSPLFRSLAGKLKIAAAPFGTLAPIGTFRIRRDVRLESGMLNQAAVSLRYRPDWPIVGSRCISIRHELGCEGRSTGQKTMGRGAERCADRAPSRL